MGKVLGLDLGTNSIGWAVIERDENNDCSLLQHGVEIFQEGVAREKGNEKPSGQKRTEARGSRKHYFRKRLRKIELLKTLIDNNLCPYLSTEALNLWKLKKIYPLDDDFLAWQRTDDNKDCNPYHDRYKCLTEKLDLSQKANRYILGRALYHLNQRRGFLSNRKEQDDSQENGVVKEGINKLTEEMLAAGCEYLGEYFYKLYREGGKIRNNYTARNEHYKAEFDAICEKQQLSEELKKSLERAIFFQRPLKSQKGTVGQCPFENGKPRCPISHPRYEEFRMLQFINSIRLKYADEDERPLNEEEVKAIYGLFFRVSKPDFSFEEIAKAIAGKGNYSHYDDKRQTGYKFNYRMDTNVSGCPVSSAIINALGLHKGDDWVDDMCSIYTKSTGKDKEEILNDIWHALWEFDDNDKLAAWLVESLQIDSTKANSLVKARVPQGYAALSHKAIIKILPWLRKGYKYSDAVFFANLPAVLPKRIASNSKLMSEVEENIRICLEDFPNNPLDKKSNKIKAITEYILGLGDGTHPEKLYHPSMIDTYPQAKPNKEGKIRLGSPRTNAFKNPMAMRSLFRLRSLINSLLDENIIDPDTKINIEFSRELNDANKRKAIQLYQKEQAEKHKRYKAEIQEHFRENLGIEYNPTEDDILKYQLYEEQNKRCIYTDKTITPPMFLGTATEFDIEHTLPRSKGGDDSQMNKTLCDSRYNRDIKRTFLPSELPDHKAILGRIEPWEQNVEDLEKQLAKAYKSKKYAKTKDAKDAIITKIHLLKMKRDYWKGKVERFKMTKIPDGFSNRQGVDIGIIGRYARLFLKTVFNNIYIVKGATTASFRKAWGLQNEYAKKERVNHSHHCIDAITIACIGKKEYDNWAQYVSKEESFRKGKGTRPRFEKPWPSFTEDVLAVPDSLLVYHDSQDNLPNRAKKKLRRRGIILKNDAGEPLYSQGDTARGSLHNATFYGAIKNDEQIKYVVRKPIEEIISKEDIDKIVDPVVREKVRAARNSKEEKVWMNEEKQIPIKKVRIFASPTAPIKLKEHRDHSSKDYKTPYYVTNESNYCLATYGQDKPDFEIVNNLEAASYYNGHKDSLVPGSKNGRPLNFLIRIGMMVLLYEESPSEIDFKNTRDVSKRLYKVTGLSISIIPNSKDKNKKYYYSLITLRHHQEARQSSTLAAKKGTWKNGEEYRPVIVLNNNQFKFLLEGRDFILSETGEITIITK